MLAIVFGLLSVAVGIWMVASWFGSFVTVVRGLLPLLFFGGGLMAIMAGITTILDAVKEKKSATPAAPVEGK